MHSLARNTSRIGWNVAGQVSCLLLLHSMMMDFSYETFAVACATILTLVNILSSKVCKVDNDTHLEDPDFLFRRRRYV